MQKISVNAGFSCPNRDGTLGTGGCIYCNNTSFNPGYCSAEKSVKQQLEEGKKFFQRKYPKMQYLAYFQAYTSTYGKDEDKLIRLYTEACEVENVKGVIIGTRPDCVNEGLIKRLKNELPWVMVEYGAETCHDATLRRINRNHTWEQVIRSVAMTAKEGIPVGLHLIMGLPHETPSMMLETIDAVNHLPIDVVKIHRLQVLRGTPLAQIWESGGANLHHWTCEEYALFCAQIVKRLRPGIAIDRFVSQSPPDMVLYPHYGMKNHEFTALVARALTP